GQALGHFPAQAAARACDQGGAAIEPELIGKGRHGAGRSSIATPELALDWRMLQLPKVIGHRGAMAYAPENTLASFREARRRGATWVEIDVKLTVDGVPIVMHDASLKRTTGVDRLVAKTPHAELPKGVPTFEEAIACFHELGLGCNVEIKPCEGREAETAR